MRAILPPSDLDLQAAANHLADREPRLRSLIAAHGLPDLPERGDPFEALASIVISQQLAGAAARTILGRVRDLSPGDAFPTPAEVLELPDEELRGAGLSAAKARYLRGLAERFADGRLGAQSVVGDDDEVAARLLEVPGIGPWSVDMFLIFVLHRPDVLPVGDLGIRKGFQAVFELDELPDAERMRELAEPWRPWRSVGSWYLWRAAEGGVPQGDG